MPPTWDETEEIKQPAQAAAPTWDETTAHDEKSLGGLASNAVKDTGEIVSNVASLAGNMVAHPVDTTKNVVTGLPSALKSWATELGIPEALHGQFGDALKKFGNSAYEHPVSRALDVASVAMPALKGMGVLKAGEIGAEGGKIAEMAGDASNALGRRELGLTKNFINNSGKMERANNTAEWANENNVMGKGLGVSDKLESVKGLKDQAWDKMSETYKNPSLAGKKLNAQGLIQAMEDMRPKNAAGKVLTGGEYDALNNEITKKINTIKASGGDIPWESAQDLKNIMKGSTRWELSQPSQINDLRKRLSGGFRGEMDKQLEDAIGSEQMGEYNTAKNDYGMAKNAIRGLENRQSSQAGNRLGGLTDWIAGAAGGAHAGPLGAIAVVAGKKVIERYGLDVGSKLLSNLSKGKYAGPIAHAATAGPAELSMTLHLLAQRDPQFAQELMQTGEQQ